MAASTRIVAFGAITYDDADGVHRMASQGDEVTLGKPDEDRLDRLGALYPKDYDPDKAALDEATAALAPMGVDSALNDARVAVGIRDAQIAELQAELLQKDQQIAALQNAPRPEGPAGSPSAKLDPAAERRAKRAAAAAQAATEPEDKNRPSAKAAAAAQAGTEQAIASDPFDSSNQTPPVAVNPDGTVVADDATKR